MRRSSSRPGRRDVLRAISIALLPAIPIRAASKAPITIWSFINVPLLSLFYRREPQGHYDDNGMVGLNIAHRTLVEEQRLGSDWVLRGIVSKREDWRQLGWRMLDIGVAWQLPDGAFQPGYFHSNSLFLAGLGRACLLDPAIGANARYRTCLDKGCNWMLQPSNLTKGMKENAPYTHRWYFLALCFGQAGVILDDAGYRIAAERFAREGLARQQQDGTNPELGGFDVSYQMVGALLAMMYYPFAPAVLREPLGAMVKRACDRTLPLIHANGEIDVSTSTRSGREIASGVLKQPNYPVAFQALAQADLLHPNAAYKTLAYRVARYKHLPVVTADKIPELIP